MAVTTADFEAATLKPGYALVEPAAPPEESMVIAIPDGSKWPQCWGKVLSMMPGKVHPGFDAGDTVVFGRTYAAHFETKERDTLCIVRSEDVMGVLDDGGIKPINGTVVLKQAELKTITDGGIYIPSLENYQGVMSDDGIPSGHMYVPKDRPNDYTVVSCCPGAEVRPGDRVICDQNRETEITVGPETYVCVRIDSVMAVIA